FPAAENVGHGGDEIRPFARIGSTVRMSALSVRSPAASRVWQAASSFSMPSGSSRTSHRAARSQPPNQAPQTDRQWSTFRDSSGLTTFPATLTHPTCSLLERPVGSLHDSRIDLVVG